MSDFFFKIRVEKGLGKPNVSRVLPPLQWFKEKSESVATLKVFVHGRSSPFSLLGERDMTNILVVFPKIRYMEVFDVKNPRFNKQISPVPWHFVKSRFHCNSYSALKAIVT